MKLWFRNSQGEERELADCETWAAVTREIRKFIHECNAKKPKSATPFKSYYTRVWKSPEDGRTMIDVGSHTEFFIWEGEYPG